MRTTTRVLCFGTISGLIWSVVPGILSELFRSSRETATVLISGVLTGVVVSLSLEAPLVKFGRWSGFVFGLLSLPLGSFAFGVLISLVQLAASKLTGGEYRFVSYGFNPFQTGFGYALVSIISVFALVLFPLAVLTTLLLRAIVKRPAVGLQKSLSPT
jgi:hypothetical protein